eukprot:CAMPEP_0205905372 /NCGR_PEP_ID=MMETSP1325-20131115/1309_1 /ASSEMBLY_ACC=CAM_ASM_000708 /TAXON_ID=236786 /ORGANISM="Florenciella sp., Strain RCC1007" /LENGTH=71 /DNA_ID=CAMNT_0053271273 /DNA_START=48 /DNA_END=263 /DNA_ORIENTATION=+
MSAPALEKTENEIAEMKKDIETFNKALPMSEACKQICTEINASPDPFSSAGQVPENPFAKTGGGGGGCTVM